jgi:D-alanyl-D-alanine carboxypeptidase
MRQGHRVLAVVLSSRDRYADMRALLDYAVTGWRWVSAALPVDALAWQPDQHGNPYRLRSAETFDIFLPAWQWRLVEPVRRLDASVPLTGTLPVGTLEWRLGERLVAAVPLRVMEGP